MKSARVESRIQQILAAELQQPVGWYYFSFVDSAFIGGVILRAHGITDGLMRAHELGINPGGEVMCWPVSEERLPAEKYRNRLLSKTEIMDFWPDAKRIADHESGVRPEK